MIKNKEIIQYYQDCDNSYQHWGIHEIYEMHYGYWDKTVKGHSDSLIRMNYFLSEEMRINTKDKILDAGCGVGAASLWLAKQYGNIEIVGINISKMQIDKANSFAKKLRINNRVRFLKRNYLNTGFADESFDIVFAIESVCHTENKNDFIKEAYRILKPDGKLILSDYFLIKNNLSKFEKRIMRLYLNGWTIPNLARKENFFKGLEMSGFKSIKCSDKTVNILPSSKIMFKKGCSGLLFDKIIKRKNKVQYANTITCFFQYVALKMKLWRYLVFYAEK
ncbi:MAG: methyltransferase domain-containing protein [Xanthomonadaceae bacterium]|nr:methyltransferase domain-containing protein [Rhodospirillaceae bacterium]NIA18156.1 methyltransferase domain-containing protein [Xanthomonadaceae bacterium]